MHPQYPIYVATATLEAHIQLQDLLARWKVAPSEDILRDAARIGEQRAMQKMFPGEGRPPFELAASHDVFYTLMMHYLGAGHHPVATMPAPVPIRELSSSARLPKVAAEASAEARVVERLDEVMSDEIDRRRVALDAMKRKLYGRGEESSAQGARTPHTTGGGESSSGAVGAGAGSATPASTSQSRLRKIDKPALFPWEKRGG